jgi:serine protease Do
MSKYLSFIVIALLMFIIAIPDQGIGQSSKGYLGLNLQDVTSKIVKKKHLPVDRGAYVTSVVEDSPADDAGIERGDVIVKLNDKTIDDEDDLRKAIKNTKPHTDVSIDLYRDGDKKTLTATVGKTKSININLGSFQWFDDLFDDDNHEIQITKPAKPAKPSKPIRLHNIVINSQNETNGLQVQELTKQLGDYFGVPNGEGVLISKVNKGSEADKAGFKAGDVITRINNNSVYDCSEFVEDMNHYGGKSVTFDVIRKSKTMTLNMKIERDDEWDDWEE